MFLDSMACGKVKLRVVQVTSSDIRITCSNLQVTSSNPWVRRLKAQVSRLKARVGGLKAQVRRLKARVEPIKPQVKWQTYDFKKNYEFKTLNLSSYKKPQLHSISANFTA